MGGVCRGCTARQRTNIEIDEDHLEVALGNLAGERMSPEEALAMYGAYALASVLMDLAETSDRIAVTPLKLSPKCRDTRGTGRLHDRLRHRAFRVGASDGFRQAPARWSAASNSSTVVDGASHV